MLYDPSRHEALDAVSWDEACARASIEAIVADTEARFTPDGAWPIHPLDADNGAATPLHPLYFGAAGVIWALHHLASAGACRLARAYTDADVVPLVVRTRAWQRGFGEAEPASYLMGETGIDLVRYALRPDARVADRIADLVAANREHPAREFMWGAPGTLLAALFMHQRTAEARWAQLFRSTAATLWSQLRWSREFGCRYWTQDLYGMTCAYLDGVHGFVATVSPLVRGRHLLDPDAWSAWAGCIAETLSRTATRQGDLVNWRPWLDWQPRPGKPMLMQYCHGAPGFVVCAGDFPDASLDALLRGAGEAIWAAGPLRKGSNLCHGTGGNGYAFLKLFARTGDALWLERARAFAMHGIAQTESHAARYGQMRYSLWTGDPGFAIYLWDCISARASFPTVDVFFDGYSSTIRGK
jgi:hypothetical protein